MRMDAHRKRKGSKKACFERKALNSHKTKKEGDGPLPTLIYMHGGGFILGTKDDFHSADFMGCIDEGFAFVSVEQRLCSVYKRRIIWMT